MVDIHLKVELSSIGDVEVSKRTLWSRLDKLCSMFKVKCEKVETKKDHLYEAKLTFLRREETDKFTNFYFQFCVETLVNSLRGNGFLESKFIEVLKPELVTFDWSLTC